MSVPSELWGAATWRAIHAVALGHDAMRREPADSSSSSSSYVMFLRSLGQVLPCERCRAGFDDAMSGDLASAMHEALRRRELFAWTVALHNHVNGKLGRPPMAVDEARAAFLSGPGVDRPSRMEHAFERLAAGMLVAALLAGGVSWWSWWSWRTGRRGVV